MDIVEMGEAIKNFPIYIEDAVNRVKGFKIGSNIKNIIIVGMGGSGIGGDLLKIYLRDVNLRIEVVKEPILPVYADKDTLLIASSYSGNTEETIEVYRKAVRKGCKILGITSNGKLQELCKRHNYQYIQMPKGFQPRAALPYSFFMLLKMFENSDLIPDQKKYINETIKALKKPIYEKLARDIVTRVKGKIPLIYASNRYEAVVMRWKTQFNENTKCPAFYHILPEQNHNEIQGFKVKLADFQAIILKDDSDHKIVNKRIEPTIELLKKQRVPSLEISISGSCELAKLFSTIFMGDLASYYLAQEYGIEPNSVPLIKELKEKINE